MRAHFENAMLRFKKRMWITQEHSSEVIDCNHTDEKVPLDSSLPEAPELPEGPETVVTLRFIMCFSILCAALGLTALDYSATGNIMSKIGNDLHATTTQVEWIGNGYALGACVMQLPISALSDIFGRKNLIMVSFMFFFIGSILSATAQNMSAMIAGRVIQGVGGGGCYVLPEVILADTVPLRQRSLFYAVLMVVWAVFSGAAPIIAGAFADYASWRWLFYLNLFISGFAILASPYAIRLKHQVGHENSWVTKLMHVDFVGAILVIGSGVSVLLALSRGGSTADLSWDTWPILVPLILGVAGFVATAAYEYWRQPSVPMFNIKVFRNPSAIICYIHNVLQGIVNLCSIYYLPSFFQGAKGFNALVSGVCILPLNLIGPPVNVFVGILIEKTGHYHLVNLIMWALATAGMGLMTLYDGERSVVQLIFLQFTGSVGISCLYSTLSITANATNPPSLWTESTAMMSFFRAFGDVFGTAIGGAVLASQMRTRLKTLEEQGYNVPDSTNVLTLVSLIHKIDSPQLKKALVDVLSKSIQTVFIVLTAFCGFSFVITLFQKEYSLDQSGNSKQGIDNEKKTD